MFKQQIWKHTGDGEIISLILSHGHLLEATILLRIVKKLPFLVMKSGYEHLLEHRHLLEILQYLCTQSRPKSECTLVRPSGRAEGLQYHHFYFRYQYSQTCVKRPYRTIHIFGFSDRWSLIAERK